MVPLNDQTESRFNGDKIWRWILRLTFVTAAISISWFTSHVTVPCLFVTQSVIETVTTAVVDTVISIGPVNTLCNRLYYYNLEPSYI